MKFNEEMNVKIISKEEANKEIIFALQHIYGFRTRMGCDGVVRMEEYEVACVYSCMSIAIEESFEMNKGLFRLSFSCSILRCVTCEPDEMLKNAEFIRKVASAAEYLNDLFKDVLVEE